MNAAAFRLVAPPIEGADARTRRTGTGLRARSRIRLEHAGSFALRPGDTRHEAREARLREILTREGFAVNDVRVVTHPIDDDPVALQNLREAPALPR